VGSCGFDFATNDFGRGPDRLAGMRREARLRDIAEGHPSGIERPEDPKAHVAEDKRGGDFSDLIGKWIPDPAFDDIITLQRRIDSPKWKSSLDD